MTAQITRHEAEVDTKIAAAHGAYVKATNALVKNMQTYTDRTRNYEYLTLTSDEAVAVAITDCTASDSYVLNRLADVLADNHAQYLDAKSAYEVAAQDYEGWNRFILVPGGHIHASAVCGSLRFNTKIAWLPELSGLTVEDAVTEYGEILCSRCFPDAPVAWTLKKQGEADEKANDVCPGSGTGETVEGTQNRYGYAVCQHCDEMIAPRSKYNWSVMRKHKVKK